ncbi:hypothetical protein [Salinibacterium sp. ZJ450]|uniref:hypothetical protein n=1 Tax=Salinibacterium sp. ZJ450 TaxID=2708338 RepID=UPI001CD3BF69|nr:hypothetical protein [Salinibacterium sp. ZJ450]
MIVVDVIAGGAAASSEAATSTLADPDSATIDLRPNDTVELPGRGGRRATA